MVRPRVPPPSLEPPKYPEEYLRWLQADHGVQTDKLRNHYQAVANAIQKALTECPFWCELHSKLHDLNDAYKIKHKYQLFTNYEVDIIQKPYDSFLLKTYRKNIILNANWPKELSTGWLLPPEWYSKINDIARTTLVVKYLDGIEFLLEEINNIAKRLDGPITYDLEARPEGYYAAHAYFSLPVEIPKIDCDTEIIEIELEIQITTQLKDIIKSLLHQHYEQKKIQSPKISQNWQWDYKSEEFSTNYLGHILHYVDGMIMGIIDKERSS